MNHHANQVFEVAKNEKRYLNYEETERLLGAPLVVYLNDWNIRDYSLHLQLFRDQRIYSIMSRDPKKSHIKPDNWTTERLRTKFKEKGLSFPDGLSIP